MALKLSIIIVNYNVRYFLEHCLHSAMNALDDRMEIIVIDNASTDDSREMMAQRFPQIKYIYETQNHGFSKANNIGIRLSKAEYVLLLNPDTVVKEDSFSKCIDFMDAHQDCGGLGIHMVDGQGIFLPESKRGLPTPSAAFYKIFGLSRFFPKSRKFGKYHLGFLDEYETNEIEILSGAYMMMRQSALNKCGLLDEDYFMYGEDIDLSYKILKAGYKNYYFPETEIIHYKGESTKKGSINYVFVFYRAMVIFAKKHFDKGQASTFGLLINLAIYFRAFLAVLSRLFGRSWQMIIDFLLIYAVFFIATKFYEVIQSKDFSLPFVSIALPAYALIMVVSLLFSGAYDKPLRWPKLTQGWFASTLILLAFYALLPEDYRFSRAVILLGSAVSFAISIVWRLILLQFKAFQEIISPRVNKRRLIVGSSKSLEKVASFYEIEEIENEFIAGICVGNEHPLPINFVGHLSKITEAVKIFKIEEIIWCCDDLSYARIIDGIKALRDTNVEHMIASKGIEYLIGSQRVVSAHEHKSTRSLRSINLAAIHRNKRISDLTISSICILILPICILFVDQKGGFIRNIFQVFQGKKSWIGLDNRGLTPDLPKFKKGVIHPLVHVILGTEFSNPAIEANVSYLQKHTVFTDLKLVLAHFPLLGN